MIPSFPPAAPTASLADLPVAGHTLHVRLHILNDLHLESASFNPAATGADVVVLTGDVWRCWLQRFRNGGECLQVTA
jgi:hypothetical protein